MKVDFRKVEKGLRLGITSLILIRLLFSYSYEVRGYYAVGGEFFVLPLLILLSYLKDALKDIWEVLSNDTSSK